MRLTDKIVEHLELMLGVANNITRNRDDASEIVQQTCLIVIIEIEEGKLITDLGNYLIFVLYKVAVRFYKREDRYEPLEYSFHGLDELSNDDIEIYLENEEYLKKTTAIRCELAYLEERYRKPYVLRYFHKESFESISKKLKIPIATVFDRLEKGRSIMLEGFKEGKSYLDTSYEPKYIFITFGGRVGKNGEPRNIITNLIDHNVLIIVAYTPRTIAEISKIMGVATAYVEESVKKLQKYGLLSCSGKNYYTNFLILYEADLMNLQAISKNAVNESFDKVKNIFSDLVEEIDKLAIFTEFDKVQKYLFTITLTCANTQNYFINTLKLLKVEDYPEKFDSGKWVIDVGFVTESEDTIPPSYLYTHGPWINHFYDGLSFLEFDTAIGKTYRADYTMSTTNRERAKILHDISKNNEIDPNYSPLIRDFIRLGFITPISGKGKKWNLCVPVLLDSEYKNLNSICKKYSEKFTSKIGKYLIDVIQKNKIDHPKWIESNQTFINLASLTAVPLYYVMKFAETGVIDIKKDKNYPVTLIIEKKSK